MAPKGMKRPSGAAAGSGKKQKVEKVAEKKCATIAAALAAAEGPLPAPVFGMLSKLLPESMMTYQEDRHDFQVTAIKMVGEALSAIEADLKGKIEPLAAQVAGAEAEQAARQTTLTSAQADMEAKKAELPVKKEAVDAGKAALAEAVKACGEALKAQKDGDKEAEKNLKRQDELATFIEGAFGSLKAGGVPAKEVKAGLKTLDHIGKEFGFEAELMKSAQVTLGTAPESRGTFDAMITAELDKLLREQLASVQAEIAAAEPAKAARAQAVAEAEAAKEAAEAKLKELEEENKAAIQAEVDAVAALKAANAAVKGFAAESAATVKACKAAEDRLAQFQAGAMAAFSEMSAYSAPPPPPPAPVEEPAAEEAAPAETAEPSV